MENDSKSNEISGLEKFTINAFKEKQPDAFTKYFASNYIGVANDGVKNAVAEIEGMLKLDIKDIKVSNEQISFPEDHLAIMTYTMYVLGKLNGKDISGEIYCSTVYLKKDSAWQSILHTESKAG